MIKNTLFIFFTRVVKLLIGFASISVSAKYFGISNEKDNWLIAISLITLIDATIWGALNEMFRTKFIFIREEFGEAGAVMKIKSLIFYMVIISSLIALVYFFLKDSIILLFDFKYSLQEFQNLKLLIIWSIPFLVINQLSAIGSSILNAYNVFIIPEMAGIASAIINLVVLLFFAPIIGIKALVISYYISAILLLFAIYLYLYWKIKINFFRGYRNFKLSDFNLFYLSALPLFFNYLLGQFSNLYEKYMAISLGVGYLSILDYSRKFSDIFQSVLTGVLMTILVPVLSRNYIEKKAIEFTDNFMNIYKISQIGITFIISIFVSSSHLIVNLFYDKGSIDNLSLLKISELMIIYGWSILGVFNYMIFGLALLSMGAPKKFALAGIVTQITSLLIIVWFLPLVGISIFPAVLGTVHFISSVFFISYFPFKRIEVINIIIKYLFFLFLVCFLTEYFSKLLNANAFSSFWLIVINSMISAINILFSGMVLRLFDFKNFRIKIITLKNAILFK